MFEFFLALFGGAYYAHKGLQHHHEKVVRKTNAENITNKVHDRSNAMDIWEATVTDRQLEEEVEYKVFDRSRYEEVMSEVRSVYPELGEGSSVALQNLAFHTDMVPLIYGKRTKNQSEQIVRADRLFAMRVLMANRGKLLVRDTHGINQSLWSEDIPAIQRRKWHMDEVEFIKWIDKKLKQHGINYKLYTYMWTYPKNKAHIITDDDWIRQSWNYVSMAYVWEPFITFGIDEVID